MSMRPSHETQPDDDAVPPVPDAPVVVGDRYELGPALGHGGTATVYRARDRVLERTVAVKLFTQGVVGPDQRRHDYEVRALAHLNHPGLVALYDAGEHDGRTYLVMQLVEGQTLGERLGGEQLSPEATIALGAALSDTLSYVHERGVVHRDLKPANVLLDADGHPLITDFGIARLVDTTRVTATGFMVGTAGYLAPEQVRGQAVEPAADVFALGLVLLECITGRREYPGGALEAAVARLHRSPEIPDDLPEPLATLLLRMLSDEPAERASAAEVATVLRAAVDGSSTAVMETGGGTATLAVAPLAAPVTGPRTQPVGVPPERPSTPPARRNRRAALLTAGGAVVVVLATVLAVLALRGPPETPAEPARPSPTAVSPAQPPVGGQPTGDTADPTTTAGEPPDTGAPMPAPAPPPPAGTTQPTQQETTGTATEPAETTAEQPTSTGDDEPGVLPDGTEDQSDGGSR
ncbi:MAG: protein kinase [Pseudonocardiaceae bacterium]|nr:protein kinase [Pseudonocardiaceae bacterium]